MNKYFSTFLVIFLFIETSCTKKTEITSSFDNTHDRIWVGKDFWSIPLEDWKVEAGKLHCVGDVPQSRVNLLTYVLSPGIGRFEVSVNIGLTSSGDEPGSAGLLIGVHDDEDPCVQSACYFGSGVNAGVSLKGYAFLKEERVELPEGFDYSEFKIKVEGTDSHLRMQISDKYGVGIRNISTKVDGLHGLIAIANNLDLGGNEKIGKSTFCFDDFRLSGSKVNEKPENSFGPILWTMYTLSKGTVKLMALLPPIGEADNQNVNLQLKEDGIWETVSTERLEPDSRTVVFRLENWDDTKDVDYRVKYVMKGKDGMETNEYYTGTIRKDQIDRPLKLGGLTCQHYLGFPYTPLVQNLKKLNPDILYFSGDQIYEINGGYQIKREPEDVSILNYLGKYYMFGWAFGDLIRDRPTICTPDDHDIFQGNLWGESGEDMAEGARVGTVGGFRQSARMVNVVNQTNCGQLPDPTDPTPIKQGMSVWYTSIIYGKISFAIISDRVFKSSPEIVSNWEGRNDQLTVPPEDLSILDKPGLKLIGKRQTEFLNEWITDWEGAEMKVLLSQTLFANPATHHGGLEGYLFGDLDSGGWPKSDRDKVIRIIRKAAVFHINGDQHVTSLVQYGLENYRDAGWSFCTPAITVGYQRWFLPDEVGYPIVDRPEHRYSNTGKYTDAFGNKNYVYAIGNPGEISIDRKSRYNQSQLRASGFGMVIFDQKDRTIEIESWRFLANVDNSNPIRDQFPGWPLRITQFDNLGFGANNVLPEITVNKPNQVLKVLNEKTGEIAQIYRIKGTVVQPSLYEGGTFTITVGDGENMKKMTGLSTRKGKNERKILVEI